MRAVVCTLFLWGAVCLTVRGQSTLVSMEAAAALFEGNLPCKTWDCDCAFTAQRGCCCATTKLHQLEEYTLQRVTGLSHSLSALDATAQDIIGGMRVAFSASMTRRLTCFGPFTSTVPISYSAVSINHGNGYNPSLGAFTAPRAGLYSFSFTAYSQVGDPGSRMYYKVQLMKNGEVIASSWEANREDSEDSSSQTVLLQLERGGQVYVELMSGRRLCGDIMGANTFSGFLVYPMA